MNLTNAIAAVFYEAIHHSSCFPHIIYRHSYL